LIERFYDPDEGAVSFNGNNITTLQAGWYRDQIGKPLIKYVLLKDTTQFVYLNF